MEITISVRAIFDKLDNPVCIKCVENDGFAYSLFLKIKDNFLAKTYLN